jgi:hypothetical protein
MDTVIPSTSVAQLARLLGTPHGLFVIGVLHAWRRRAQTENEWGGTELAR